MDLLTLETERKLQERAPRIRNARIVEASSKGLIGLGFIGAGAINFIEGNDSMEVPGFLAIGALLAGSTRRDCAEIWQLNDQISARFPEIVMVQPGNESGPLSTEPQVLMAVAV